MQQHQQLNWAAAFCPASGIKIGRAADSPASPSTSSSVSTLQSIALVLLVLWLLGHSTSSIAATPVSVYQIESGSFQQTLNVNADIVAVAEVNLAAEVNAVVTELFVEAGDSVEAGSKLVQLDDTLPAFALQRAKAELNRRLAELELAELEAARIASVFKQRLASQEEYDRSNAQLKRARADVAAQRATVASAAALLDKHQLSAPFSGLITERHISQGAWLNPGEPLLTLTALAPLRALVRVPQQYFPRFRQAQRDGNLRMALPDEVNATSSSQGTNTNNDSSVKLLKIDTLVRRADNSRQFELWAELETPSGNWLPGMSLPARLQWEVRPQAAELIVPEDALVQLSSGSFRVWKVEIPNPAEPSAASVNAVAVEVLQRSNGYALIRPAAELSLQIADRIVTVGNESLRPKQAVTISTAE